MTESGRVVVAIEYGLVAAVIASFFALAAAGLAFGFDFDLWPNWQARFVGIVAAMAGVAGAALGMHAALREQR